MTTVTVENVSRRFVIDEGKQKRITVLDNISFKVNSGDTLAILGPSGCGKTTLLRIIAGLDEPNTGRILYNELPLPSVPREERGIGMVFQSYALMPHWEAERTIGFFLSLRRRRQEVPERLKLVSKITGVGIEHLLARYPRNLSGGEKQRVAIARAFARDLKLMLLDEPFANLDAQLRSEARVELHRLLDEFPVTTIFVTHDQHDAAFLAKHLIVMQRGQIEQTGSYDTLHEDPDNLFVAQFIGVPTINLFHGEIVDGQWQGRNFGGYAPPQYLPDSTLVTLAIRPANITLSEVGITCVIKKMTHFYAERCTLLEVILNEEAWQIEIPLEQSEGIEEDQQIRCQLDPNKILFFDSYSGQRIR